MMPNRITHIKYLVSLIFAMSFVCLSAWFGQANTSFNQTSFELISNLDNNPINLDSDDDKLVYFFTDQQFDLPCCCSCCDSATIPQFEIQPSSHLIALQRAPPQLLI
ncbi:hypothetical protein [Pseudoalteromonas tunicata]|jgi:hypothetical protein|uniref:Uncharacterized protein n=1 Tax=Pseudoalteromonas tunicata D2 TaxID=87626 RepID=A4CEC4_9GAMM|nr:hypothetical protein [Pseudoalteromonas tunicata]EAR26936.1 hypothetical protein PTD2_10158 [Pseudoalteromonas tunicata D2]